MRATMALNGLKLATVGTRMRKTSKVDLLNIV